MRIIPDTMVFADSIREQVILVNCSIEYLINQCGKFSLPKLIFESKLYKLALLRICSLALEALRNKSLKASIV